MRVEFYITLAGGPADGEAYTVEGECPPEVVTIPHRAKPPRVSSSGDYPRGPIAVEAVDYRLSARDGAHLLYHVGQAIETRWQIAIPEGRWRAERLAEQMAKLPALPKTWAWGTRPLKGPDDEPAGMELLRAYPQYVGSTI